MDIGAPTLGTLLRLDAHAQYIGDVWGVYGDIPVTYSADSAAPAKTTLEDIEVGAIYVDRVAGHRHADGRGRTTRLPLSAWT